MNRQDKIIFYTSLIAWFACSLFVIITPNQDERIVLAIVDVVLV